MSLLPSVVSVCSGLELFKADRVLGEYWKYRQRFNTLLKIILPFPETSWLGPVPIDEVAPDLIVQSNVSLRD